MPANRLTDRQIADFYFGLSQHYQACVSQSLSPAEIYNALVHGVHYTLNYSDSSLRSLDPREQQKVWNILNTFYAATPQYHSVPQHYQGRQFFNDGTQQPRVVIHQHDYYHTYYHRNDDFLFNWLLINQLTQRSYYGSYRQGGCGHPHHHHHRSEEEKKNNEALAFLLLLLLAVAIAACAFVALYYMLSETLDACERFFYNEGWMQATISMLSLAVTTAASTLLASAFASSALFSLAIAAGVANPFGWVIFGVIGLGVVGGALTHLLSESIHAYITKKTNMDALDPQDPSRFALTDQEVEALESKGLDPIKVKCAMVALRWEMGDKPVPSLLSRLFSRDTKMQDTLLTIRELRNGNLQNLRVGEMSFDFSMNGHYNPVRLDDNQPETFPQQSGGQNPQDYQGYQYQYVEPSAPFINL